MKIGIMASQISGHLTPATNYESIATANGTGSSGVISFSSIPTDYTHLQIRFIARDDRAVAEDTMSLQFNADTGSNYKRYHLLQGDGATASADAGASSYTNHLFSYATGSSATAGIMCAGVTDILDYANTNKYKTIRTLSGDDRNGAGSISLWSGLWLSSSAISSFTITAGSGNFTTLASFALYGVK